MKKRKAGRPKGSKNKKGKISISYDDQKEVVLNVSKVKRIYSHLYMIFRELER